MAEEYDVIIDMAKGSGREVFLTDGEFNTIWSSSDRKISDLLLSADKDGLRGRPERETCISMRNGSVLKITPIKRGDTVRYYLFEVYDTGSLIDMAAPSGAFREYARQYSELRSTILELAAASGNSSSGIEQVLSTFSNKTAFFAMLSTEGKQPCLNISGALTRLCGTFEGILSKNGRVDFGFEIEEGLYSRASRSALKYAVSNLLSNALLYCDGDIKKINVRAYAEGDDILISVADNGKSGDIQLLDRYRDAFAGSGSEGKESLGIAIADRFAAGCGGSLSFEKDDEGLKAVIRLPRCEPSEDMTLYSPSAFGNESSENAIARDIFMKGMEPEDIRFFELGDRYIK